MSIAVAASCTRRDCRQPAVRMIHCSPAAHVAPTPGSNGVGPYLVTLRCSVCGHTWAVRRDTPQALAIVATREPQKPRGW